MTLSDFRVAMLLWCYTFDARETSGIRSPFHNVHLGGLTHSAHLAGLAADVVYRLTPAVSERAAWARRLGLRLVVEDDHDHLQPLDWEAE